MLFRAGIRRLGTKESGLFYRYPDTGETVRAGRVLGRIENLKVPPAREKVLIARVGDERYAKKNKTYGIAALRREHLRIEGDTIIFLPQHLWSPWYARARH